MSLPRTRNTVRRKRASANGLAVRAAAAAHQSREILEKLHRYEASYRRTFERALATLIGIQSERRLRAPNLDELSGPRFVLSSGKNQETAANTAKPSEPALETTPRGAADENPDPTAR